MMKREYIQPTVHVVAMKHQTHLLAGSQYGMNETQQGTNNPDDEVTGAW